MNSNLISGFQSLRRSTPIKIVDGKMVALIQDEKQEEGDDSDVESGFPRQEVLP